MQHVACSSLRSPCVAVASTPRDFTCTSEPMELNLLPPTLQKQQKPKAQLQQFHFLRTLPDTCFRSPAVCSIVAFLTVQKRGFWGVQCPWHGIRVKAEKRHVSLECLVTCCFCGPRCPVPAFKTRLSNLLTKGSPPIGQEEVMARQRASATHLGCWNMESMKRL